MGDVLCGSGGSKHVVVAQRHTEAHVGGAGCAEVAAAGPAECRRRVERAVCRRRVERAVCRQRME